MPKKENQPNTPAKRTQDHAAEQIHTLAEQAANLIFENITLDQLEQLDEIEQNPKKAPPTILEMAIVAAQEAHEKFMAMQTKDGTGSVKIDFSSYGHKLDPQSLEFDLEEYKKAINIGENWEVMQDQIIESMQKSERETIEPLASTVQKVMAELMEFLNSDAYKEVKKSLEEVSEYIKKRRPINLQLFAESAKEIDGLVPFLQIEIDEHNQQHPEEEPVTVDDVLSFMEITGEPITEINGRLGDNPFIDLIEKAKLKKAEFESAEATIEKIEQAAEEFPRIISRPTDKLSYPLDKANSTIWNIIAAADPDGQLPLIEIDTSPKGSNKEASVLYGINFDELETSLKITKALTPFDKRCYIAAAALFDGGNAIVSATQIYKMMGNRGQPKAADIQKINDSITKMSKARILIDNEKEAQANTKYSRFRYDASLLPMERTSAYINNTLTESAIHLFREPPLITFARERKQITSLPRQLLESPVSKTDGNLRIDNYLIERISHMKRGKGKAPKKILYSTLFDRCEIRTAKQRQRAREKIRRYLDYYQKCEFIKGYQDDKDGVTILL